jgi:ATP/maltotriose-dependent transcriptional regulator MalT
VAWLSLDEGDNDPARFWRHTVAAMGRARPGVGELATPEPGLLAPVSAHGPVAALINELAAQPGDDELLLVLDDYHLIDSQGLHASLLFLLEHLPPGLRLVVASRSDPPLPLARLRAAGTRVGGRRRGGRRGGRPGRALTLACPQGYVRVFADEGLPMAALLGAFGERAATPGAGRGAAAVVPGLVAQLTARELEVLALLAAGRSNQRIAHELVVALDTVKKHVTHVLGKLGAANRTEAVAQARQLGLIP